MRCSEVFDEKILKFLFVGALNTLLGAGIMFGLYNLAGLGYWSSSAVSYITASIFSFFMNRSFTFGDKSSPGLPALKFTANIVVCYLLSFSLAKPLILLLLNSMNLSQNTTDNIAMLAGMIMFTGFNYIGQRYFVFREGIR
ncbi:MAG: GtrA family protein [Acidobacteria bacterium]|nr:GtrA family protein [Acidobacteriota bacterium]